MPVPPTSDVPSAESLLENLDPEQRAVATSITGPVVVIAGAGTGKTRAITHRIAYGVAQGAYAPTQVLAVTFTNRAAGEMRGRLQELGAHGVQARTFHSAALRQAQYFWPKAYGRPLPPLADNRYALVVEAARRLRIETDQGMVRDLLGEIGWSKVSNADADNYPAVARRTGREVSGLEPETIARVFAGYERLKADSGVIDFEDILLCCAALLEENAVIADEVRRTYRHLVVDEYQDVSPLQQALLNLWRGPSEEICVVGDPAQTIHSFAGARADYLTGFTRRHPDATVVRLVRDYRSTPEVVKVANLVIGASGPHALVAQRPSGPEPVWAEAADEEEEAAGIAAWLAGLAEAGVDHREMAVLFRINAQSPQIEKALDAAGIPYLVRGAERFYDRAEVKRGIGLLRAQSRTSDDEVPVLDQVKALLEPIGWRETAPTGTGSRREKWESLAALVDLVRDLLAEDPQASLADVAEVLQARAAADHAPIAHGVTLSTFHAAKGLEWDAVALSGVHDGSVPFVLATGAQALEEERRLLYVGVTRARQHLRVSWSRARSGSNGRRRPSRFLEGVMPAADRTTPTRSAGSSRRRRSALSATCRACGKPLQDAAERKLGHHHDCQVEYDEATFEALRRWRRMEAKGQSMPAYVILTDATLLAIAEVRPGDEQALRSVSGIGATKAERYGASVLRIVADPTIVDEDGAIEAPDGML
ncbi:ATP-dependent DNA helicase, Rep family [Raineyella antarctica]|uniref:DNA 3'-5' helicase n=1 Tax=Raineyella antarctica TaxID=1577474 RepID=A0A1G6GVC4_9ACTN|nr:ATP-dependent DNA helicase UvrD2 [Raineyella antarctica]SDB85918.1 ATP-dependent DNA helicase, Rep family [Raineyella antarctica]